MAIFVDLIVLGLCELFLMFNKVSQSHDDHDMAAFFFGSRPFDRYDDEGCDSERPPINEDYDDGPNW